MTTDRDRVAMYETQLDHTQARMFTALENCTVALRVLAENLELLREAWKSHNEAADDTRQIRKQLDSRS